jgi:Domain of unknown function (DUF397)
VSSPTWRKSSHSGTQEGACVEVAQLPGTVGVRDSKNPEGGHLSLGASRFAALVTRIKHDKI